MTRIIRLILALLPALVYGQSWSSFLDQSRAIDWTGAGFTIPSYSTNCSTQPTLLTGSGSAAANTTAIQNALASCDATHNVINIPAGTYYVAGWTYGSQGKQVVRGAGPNDTTVILTAYAPCNGMQAGVCMIDSVGMFTGACQVLDASTPYCSGNPVVGTRQCSWTSGFAKGTTTITLSSCGGAPPLHQTLILDQADDASDTGGVYMCGGYDTGCVIEADTDQGGRCFETDSSGYCPHGAHVHDLAQIVYTNSVTSLGGGSYSVDITPGLYTNNVRRHAEYAGTVNEYPGAWWPGFVQNDGLENMTLNGNALSNGTIAMYDCYQCWVKNIRSLYGGVAHVRVFQSAQSVVRDSYFYGAQGTGSTSYGVPFSISSGTLVENNIFQQIVTPVIFGIGTGNVTGYNYFVNSTFNPPFFQTAYNGHGSGTQMQLWEGNNFPGIWTDAVHGSAATSTYFRNMLRAWQSGRTSDTFAVALRTWQRAYSVVANVLGQPGYHTTAAGAKYETYATSTTAGVDAGYSYKSIFELGWGDSGGFGLCINGMACDSLVRRTLMRWGNWDTVNQATQWDSTEASPGAVPYVNANFTSSYFSSLPHTLPASLYYSSKPSWWPSGKAWPVIGPDVATGDLGICNGGTYDGAQATTAGQCTGGTLTSAATAYSSHATTIPAQDCYLNVMGGPPDGTGSVLAFDALTCYTAVSPIGSGGKGGGHGKGGGKTIQ